MLHEVCLYSMAKYINVPGRPKTLNACISLNMTNVISKKIVYTAMSKVECRFLILFCESDQEVKNNNKKLCLAYLYSKRV